MKVFLVLLFAIVAVFAKPQHPQLLFNTNHLANNCTDVGTNCLNWARNGFCTNCNWTCEQRRHYCERTCGFCHPDYKCNETCTTWPPMEAKSEVLTEEEIQTLNQ
ncbi:Protein CBG20815 [Caenorhabditis briggsae]|uniref:ShKT domain-containing protein n=2 Tax=Caenorhabditis briggsae TaxID=6238 RepID=A0AAE9DNF5_CAEBR|nr:Protein CBG20815 [Caenorhabditis briggsae]ULU07494.1 hypothetical protein L3Y34_018896 [Caenorhabditis briggsae]UMM19408.1 hypothetical protein L5515_015018 [Caenorhabditis briggsae]CAP37759.1 Protein CBG20815 [Caenorhabditis briggsae]